MPRAYTDGIGLRIELVLGVESRRPPISLDTTVARTEGYTYAANVWDLSIVQGPFSVAPCQTLALRFAIFASLWAEGLSKEHRV
jgi:hypothetical protein